MEHESFVDHESSSTSSKSSSVGQEKIRESCSLGVGNGVGIWSVKWGEIRERLAQTRDGEGNRPALPSLRRGESVPPRGLPRAPVHRPLTGLDSFSEWSREGSCRKLVSLYQEEIMDEHHLAAWQIAEFIGCRLARRLPRAEAGLGGCGNQGFPAPSRGRARPFDRSTAPGCSKRGENDESNESKNGVSKQCNLVQLCSGWL